MERADDTDNFCDNDKNNNNYNNNNDDNDKILRMNNTTYSYKCNGTKRNEGNKNINRQQKSQLIWDTLNG